MVLDSNGNEITIGCTVQFENKMIFTVTHIQDGDGWIWGNDIPEGDRYVLNRWGGGKNWHKPGVCTIIEKPTQYSGNVLKHNFI